MGIYRVIEDSPKRITQHYKKGVHNGVDLGWRTDERANLVYSNCEGEVYTTLDHIPHGSEAGGGWGNYVLIKHPNGYYSRYAHLQENLPVKKGDKVTKDTVIGIIGNTGRSTARHLHFEVSTGLSTATRVNPEPYLTRFIYGSDLLRYKAHIEDYGWQNWKYNGETAGTTGESKRLEAIQIESPFDIEAKAHIENIGWVDYGKINKDTVIGTTGQGLRLECLCLKGNIKYRVHIEEAGWSCWTHADGISTLGSVGEALRIEAIEIRSL